MQIVLPVAAAMADPRNLDCATLRYLCCGVQRNFKLLRPSAKCVAHFFVGGKVSAVRRCDTQICGLPRAGSLNDVIQEASGGKSVGQSVKLLAHGRIGFANKALLRIQTVKPNRNAQL
jgi:hypothetical protein